MASALAESPSVRMRVHLSELRPPASFASSSLGMPAHHRSLKGPPPHRSVGNTDSDSAGCRFAREQNAVVDRTMLQPQQTYASVEQLLVL